MGHGLAGMPRDRFDFPNDWDRTDRPKTLSRRYAEIILRPTATLPKPHLPTTYRPTGKTNNEPVDRAAIEQITK
jgi:hypothetical protein